MKKLASFLLLLAVALHVQAVAPVASSVARTWVSGVGDDANPGSRTAPCLTFAGALAQTSPGGEINTLDAGNYAGVTITQSVTIDGENNPADIIVQSGPAVTITASSTPLIVTLRNLNLNGEATGTTGIMATGPVNLRLVNCRISGFTGAAVAFQGSNGASLQMENCDLHDCSGGGVLLQPSQPTVAAKLKDVTITKCGASGVSNQAGSIAVLNGVKCSLISGPAFTCATGTRMTITHSVAALCSSGVVANGTVYLSESDIIGNTGAGLTSSGGTLYTSGDNRVSGNTPDGSATPVVPLK